MVAGNVVYDRRPKRGAMWPTEFDNHIRGKDGLTDWCRVNGILSRAECERYNGNPDNFGSREDAVHLETFPAGFFDSTNTSLRIGVFLFTLISAMCVALTIFFTIVLVLGWKTHFQFPIYRIILQLSIGYFILSTSQFFTNIPIYLFNIEPKQDDLVKIVPFVMEQTANYAAILFYTLLTVNRLAIFTVTSLKEIFSSTNVHIALVICWLIAILASCFMIFYGCTRSFDNKVYLYTDVCRPQSYMLKTVYQVLFYFFYLLPPLNLVMYVAIGISIYSSRNGGTVAMSKTELALLKQAVFIFVLYMVAITISLLQPFISFKTRAQVYIATMLIGVMDPLLGVIFVGTFIGSNRTVQKAIRDKMPKQIAGRLFGHSQVEPGQLFARSPTHTHEDH